MMLPVTVCYSCSMIFGNRPITVFYRDFKKSCDSVSLNHDDIDDNDNDDDNHLDTKLLSQWICFTSINA